MPCRSDPDPNEERKAREATARYEREQRERLDKLTRMLCTLGNAVMDCCYDFEDDIDIEREEALEIEEWLQDHNERDQKRRAKEEAAAKARAAAEAAKKKKIKLAENAKKKLTKAERKALGLE